LAATVGRGSGERRALAVHRLAELGLPEYTDVVAASLEELSFRRYPRFRDLFRLLGVAVLENVGYRQLSTYWRIRGMISKLGGAHTWGAMERRGFRPTPERA
jgi:hypothetical protein